MQEKLRSDILNLGTTCSKKQETLTLARGNQSRSKGSRESRGVKKQKEFKQQKTKIAEAIA